jgi:hypothetical protein
VSKARLMETGYIYIYKSPLIRFPKVYSKTTNKLLERNVINLSSWDDIAAEMSLDICRACVPFHPMLVSVPCIDDILRNIDIILAIER